MPEYLTDTERAQQRARDAVLASATGPNSTRQLITQSLMQAWRMGGGSGGSSSAVVTNDTHVEPVEDEITLLRNKRLELMRKNLKYKLIGEDELQQEDTSCGIEIEDGDNNDIEKGEVQHNTSSSSHNQENIQNSRIRVPATICETRKECPICLDPYTPGEKMAITITNGCGHAFHDECITLWLLQHDHCPLCRTQLLDENVDEDKVTMMAQ